MEGGKQEIKILGSWVSPYTHRVELVLKIKGLNYELVDQDLIRKSPLLIKHNPINKQVPVLLHGDKTVVESSIIVEYIDETWKNNPILPEDPHDRAVARFWVKFIDEKINESLKRMLFTQGELQDKEQKQVIEALDILEKELKGKKFFGYEGNTIGYVDIALSWIIIGMDMIEEVSGKNVFSSDKYPLIDEWMNCFTEEAPFFKESMPPKNEMVQYFAKIRPIVLALYGSKK